MISASTTTLFLLMPEPGKAQVDACSGTIPGVAPLKDSIGNIQALDVTLEDGTKYTLCTIKAKPTADILKQTPWFLAGGTSLATDLADAVYKQHTSFVGAPTYANTSSSGNPKETNWFYEGINNKGGAPGAPASIGEGPYFLWNDKKAVAYQIPDGGFVCPGASPVNNSCTFNGQDLQKDYIFALGYDPNGIDPVPGPLPLLGAGAAFGWSRRLRRQIRTSADAASDSLMPLRVASSPEARL